MKISQLKKIGLGLAVAAVSVILPVAAYASWGPDRPTKVYTKGVAGFDHVTFNSFTGTENYGDERTFYDVKDASNTNQGGFSDELKVQPGQELLFRTYVHNGADSSLNSAANNYVGIARDAKVKVLLPTGNDTALRSISFISASNAQPGEVSDSTKLLGDTPFSLEYIPGSALMHTNATTGTPGIKLSDNIVKDGAPIGYDKADGNVPGCFEYGSVVVFKARVVAPKLQITKQIGIPGSGKWQEEVAAKPGDTLSYNVHYENKGNAVAHNVVLTDKLPANVDVVPGTVKLYNPLHPEGKQLNDTSFFKEGINVSDHAVNAGGNVQFKVKVKSDLKTSFTGINTACVGSDETRKDICDTATFKVTIDCKTNPEQPQCKPPVLNCTTNPERPECKTTPPVTPPTELPETGVEAPIAGLAGMGGMSYAVTSYIRSKKNLANALRNVRK